MSGKQVSVKISQAITRKSWYLSRTQISICRDLAKNDNIRKQKKSCVSREHFVLTSQEKKNNCKNLGK